MLSPSSSKQRCRQIFVTLSPCNLCSLLPVLHDCSNALPQSLLEQVDKVMWTSSRRLSCLAFPGAVRMRVKCHAAVYWCTASSSTSTAFLHQRFPPGFLSCDHNFGNGCWASQPWTGQNPQPVATDLDQQSPKLGIPLRDCRGTACDQGVGYSAVSIQGKSMCGINMDKLCNHMQPSCTCPGCWVLSGSCQHRCLRQGNHSVAPLVAYKAWLRPWHCQPICLIALGRNGTVSTPGAKWIEMVRHN